MLFSNHMQRYSRLSALSLVYRIVLLYWEKLYGVNGLQAHIPCSASLKKLVASFYSLEKVFEDQLHIFCQFGPKHSWKAVNLVGTHSFLVFLMNMALW